MRQDTQRATCTLSLVPRMALSFICTMGIPAPSVSGLHVLIAKKCFPDAGMDGDPQPTTYAKDADKINGEVQQGEGARTLKRARAVLKRILGPSRNSTSQMRTAVSAGSAVQKRLLNQLLVTSCRSEHVQSQLTFLRRSPQRLSLSCMSHTY